LAYREGIVVVTGSRIKAALRRAGATTAPEDAKPGIPR
jgi:hypothetical protein